MYVTVHNDDVVYSNRKELKPQRQHASGGEVMEGVCEAALSAAEPEQQQQEEDMEAMELQAAWGPGEQGPSSGGTPQPDMDTSSDGQRPRYSYRWVVNHGCIIGEWFHAHLKGSGSIPEVGIQKIIRCFNVFI